MSMKAVGWLSSKLGIDISGRAEDNACGANTENCMYNNGPSTLVEENELLNSSTIEIHNTKDNFDYSNDETIDTNNKGVEEKLGQYWNQVHSVVNSYLTNLTRKSSSNNKSSFADIFASASVEEDDIYNHDNVDETVNVNTQLWRSKQKKVQEACEGVNTEVDEQGLPIQKDWYYFDTALNRWNVSPEAPESVRRDYEKQLWEEEQERCGLRVVEPPPPPRRLPQPAAYIDRQSVTSNNNNVNYSVDTSNHNADSNNYCSEHVLPSLPSMQHIPQHGLFSSGANCIQTHRRSAPKYAVPNYFASTEDNIVTNLNTKPHNIGSNLICEKDNATITNNNNNNNNNNKYYNDNKNSNSFHHYQPSENGFSYHTKMSEKGGNNNTLCEHERMLQTADVRSSFPAPPTALSTLLPMQPLQTRFPAPIASVTEAGHLSRTANSLPSEMKLEQEEHFEEINHSSINKFTIPTPPTFGNTNVNIYSVTTPFTSQAASHQPELMKEETINVSCRSNKDLQASHVLEVKPPMSKASELSDILPSESIGYYNKLYQSPEPELKEREKHNEKEYYSLEQEQSPSHTGKQYLQKSEAELLTLEHTERNSNDAHNRHDNPFVESTPEITLPVAEQNYDVKVKNILTPNEVPKTSLPALSPTLQEESNAKIIPLSMNIVNDRRNANTMNDNRARVRLPPPPSFERFRVD